MYVVATVFVVLGVCVALLTVGILILRHKSSLIFDKYPRKGLFYHLKYGIALLVLQHLRRKFYAKDVETDDVSALDRPQTLTDNPKSYDVVSFMGANEKGEKFMVTLERRRRGILKGCVYLWLPSHGLLCSPNLPDMMYFTNDGDAENGEFRGSGFHLRPAECMRKWLISYEGPLKMLQNGGTVQVKMQLQFTSSTTAYFNYNRDLSPGVIADSIARESWNDEFYSLLKSVDRILEKRTHYEQNGVLEGDIQLAMSGDGGGVVVPLKMRGFRDHSFGTERCLSTINRYVYFALFLNDGTSMVIGNLSQPSFFLSSLKVGYICDRHGVYAPITKCNFELYSYGEKGTPPKNQNFIVHTASAKYLVQIQVEDTAVRYMGGNWESKVYNQFVTCTVNGVHGQGLTEYLYRNAGGRPESVSCSDPEWYRKARNYERNLSTGNVQDESEEFFF